MRRMLLLMVDNFAIRILPQHLRKPIRIKFVQGLLEPICRIVADLVVLRRDILQRTIVTAQHGVLVGFLRNKYNTVNIDIVEYVSSGVVLGLESEGEEGAILVGLVEEGAGVLFSLYGEDDTSFGDVDFKVYIPSDIPIDQIRVDIERYRPITMKYEIIQK